MEKISNGHLEAAFSPLGAETMSLRRIQDGREFLWQGDARWWGGRSPILFPITGGLWNGVSRIGDRSYRIPKHGFVSRREWRVAEREPEAVTFAIGPQKDDADIYPYDYEVRVRYRLDGPRLEAEFEVENRGAESMYFQMGGHPGLVLPDWDEANAVDGYLRFEGAPASLLRASEQGCIEVDGAQPDSLRRYPLPQDADGLVPLGVDTFANEALILDRQITAAVLLDRNRLPVARVESSAPVWLFWSQQGQHCPYVCAEPWYGLPDLQGFSGDISRRAFIQQAGPGEIWHGGYSVEVL